MLEQSIMGQKMCFGIICINFAVRTKIFVIFFIIFRKKRQIPYSCNVKLHSAITPVPQKIVPWSLLIAGGFRNGGSNGMIAIFVHVTGSNHAARAKIYQQGEV